ncbi:MAG TPA: HAMP domain-containing sensor histidine kinase [Puia sp.]|nr:HAMP domain-containing sensor histidine kinase [Puia sp.]
MRILLWIILGALFFCQGCQQQNVVRRHNTEITASDSDRATDLWYQAELNVAHKPDSAMVYAQEGLAEARRIGYTEREGLCMLTIAKVFMSIGNYSKALETSYKSLAIIQGSGFKSVHESDLAINFYVIGEIFGDQGDYRDALFNNFKARSIVEKTTEVDDEKSMIKILLNVGYDYEQMNRLDSAVFFAESCYQLCNRDDTTRGLYSFFIGKAANLLGDIYSRIGKFNRATQFYNLGIGYAIAKTDNLSYSNALLGIAKVYATETLSDSCLYYAKESLKLAQSGNFRLEVLNASNFLTDFYKQKREYDSAFAYQQLSITTKDSLFGLQKIMEFQNISFSEKMREQELKDAEVRYRNRLSIYILIGAVVIFLVIAAMLWRNNGLKQKANALLNQQKLQIEIQKGKVEEALQTLQATQEQLVHAEKMASLGQLTAGIAHEIQNPLNFVNNFSEVNNDLIKELRAEKSKAERDLQNENDLLDNIQENLGKIMHHGRRAEIIVKGMLQHSRAGSGLKEDADVNALANEYLRLAYRNQLAKDSTFNATLNTDFDSAIGLVKIIPQDIARVFLNLYNNALYAVAEKKMHLKGKYEPVISVTSRKLADHVQFTVKDNGEGIPKKIIDKVFQPFFTTKPPGQGTGLGLSISYEMVKAHGGELKVDTREGEYTEFTVVLPAKNGA